MAPLAASGARAQPSTARLGPPRSFAPLSRHVQRRAYASTARASKGEVTLLDYGAGNVRSVRNAVAKLGYSIKDVTSVKDITSASRLLFPGVGAIGQASESLRRSGYSEALRDYVAAGRPFLGICIGMQVLFEGSEENGGVEGLGVFPGVVRKLEPEGGLPVPRIGWTPLERKGESPLLDAIGDRSVYFVHSFAAVPGGGTWGAARGGADTASSPAAAVGGGGRLGGLAADRSWEVATADYGGEYLAAVRLGEAHATQFHPEKSGEAGLDLLRAFLEPGWLPTSADAAADGAGDPAGPAAGSSNGHARRIIACLDVRANDAGKLVVTKGDQYDVREGAGEGGAPPAGVEASTSGAGAPASGAKGDVKNLGDPVELAARYFEEGADEVAFLNITAFRGTPLGDAPTLRLLRDASARVFVPLTIGGGIRGYTDETGRRVSALEVAAAYFRAGADKVSIGSDAVYAAEGYYANGGVPKGDTAIEEISAHYGAQAVVVSVDPRRVYVASPDDTRHAVVRTGRPGPAGERYCWWQCTVKGGREGRDVDAVELAKAVEALGAGEILLNCIDNDGAKQGFDLELVGAVSDAVSIPVVASSGAGAPAHFAEVFEKTSAAAALAAGIFHRREVSIGDAKRAVADAGVAVRLS